MDKWCSQKKGTCFASRKPWHAQGCCKLFTNSRGLESTATWEKTESPLCAKTWWVHIEAWLDYPAMRSTDSYCNPTQARAERVEKKTKSCSRLMLKQRTYGSLSICFRWVLHNKLEVVSITFTFCNISGICYVKKTFLIIITSGLFDVALFCKALQHM